MKKLFSELKPGDEFSIIGDGDHYIVLKFPVVITSGHPAPPFNAVETLEGEPKVIPEKLLVNKSVFEE